MTDKEKIRNIIELFIAWNGETEVIDIANLDSAVDFIVDSLQEEPISVWHDGCEIPKSETNILMIRKGEKDSNYPPIAGCFHGTNFRLDGKNWGYYNGFCYNEIEAPYKWAYIDDFLALEEIPPKFPLISQKKCMYTKDDFTDEDRKVLCDGCEEECKYAQKEEPVSEDTMTIRKEWFEHCKKSWYNEGYIDGKHNRDGQFGEPVSEEIGNYNHTAVLEGLGYQSKEEPVSDECIYNRTLEERQKSCKFCSAACQVRIKEEPVSEVLEEEAAIYIERFLDGDLGFNPRLLHSNAKLSDVYNELNMIFKAGAKWQKEQMMKDAVKCDIEGTIIGTDGNFGLARIKGDYNYGDKVKLIIVKED